MNDLLVSGSALAIAVGSAGAAPDWVQLLPAEAVTGQTWYGADGRGPLKVSDAAALLKRSCSSVAADGRSGQCDLLVDYDHQSFFPEARGLPIPAAGWIKQIQIRADGIYGQVEWTPAAAKAVADKEFRFISPQYIFNKSTGEVARIERAGLTNTPAFDTMRAVASRQTQENNMDELLAALRKALGLKETDDAKACIAAIDIAVAAAKRVDLLDAVVKAVATKLKVKPEATAAQFETAIASLSTAVTGTAASDQVIKDLQTEIAGLKATNAARSAEEMVAAAAKAGKISPAAKDWAIDYAKRDPDGFKKFLETQPVIVGTAALVQGEKPGAGGGFTSAEDAAVAKQLGLSAEQLKKGA